MRTKKTHYAVFISESQKESKDHYSFFHSEDIGYVLNKILTKTKSKDDDVFTLFETPVGTCNVYKMVMSYTEIVEYLQTLNNIKQ